MSHHSFSIGCISQFADYTCLRSNGHGHQVILPLTVHIKKFADALCATEIMCFEWGRIGRDEHVILAFWALARTAEIGFTLAEAAATANADFRLVGAINSDLLRKVEREDVIRAPTAAIFGGIGAQEVIKSISATVTAPLVSSLGIRSTTRSPVFAILLLAQGPLDARS
jgi:hypothetical protein